MSKRLRKPRSQELLQSYREKSGWWLAAWRDFKGLTLEELAEAAETSKGVVSDLETGAARTNGKPLRYNRDNLETFSKVLNVGEGHLIRLNPFDVDPDAVKLGEQVQSLNKRERALLTQFIGTLTDRSGTEG